MLNVKNMARILAKNRNTPIAKRLLGRWFREFVAAKTVGATDVAVYLGNLLGHVQAAVPGDEVITID